MKHLLIILILAIFSLSKLYSQVLAAINVTGRYVALWGETIWAYNFNPDNTYVYQTSGHFGNIKTIGKYKISKDTIVLTAFSKDLQEDPNRYFKADTLIIQSDSCLINLQTGYEHLRLKPNQEIYTSKKRNLKLSGLPIITEGF
jgi:hypothetical protein